MGIRIPKYSEQGGEVSLPTRRMTPLSPREVYAAGDAGRALSRGGQALVKAGELVFEDEKRDQEKKNKMWLVSASTDLEMEMTQASEELKLNQVPGDYISNESFVNGTNKDTYTNQTMSKFEGIVNKETDNKDGTKSQRYKAPNEATADLWEMEKARIKSKYTMQAMRHEADLRSAAYAEMLENTFTSQKSNVFDNPGNLETMMNKVDILVVGKDDPKTKDIEGYGNRISGKALLGVAKAQKKELIVEAFRGNAVKEPLRTWMILNGDIQGKDAGVFSGKLAFLTSGEIDTLKNYAKQNIIIDNNKKIKVLSEGHGTNLVKFAAGQEADHPELTTYDNIKASVYGLYGDTDKEIEVMFKIFPDLKVKADQLVDTMTSEVRVGLITKEYVNYAHKASNEEVIAMINAIADAPKASKAQITKRFTDLFPEKKGLVEGLTLEEMVNGLNTAATAMANDLSTRSSDFVSFANTIDAIQVMPEGPEKYAAIKAYGEEVGLSIVPMFTNDEAAKIVASAKGIKNGEQASAWMGNLAQKFGDKPETLDIEGKELFDLAWHQLTTMNNGLGSKWQLMGLFHGSNEAMVFGSAALADTDDLIEIVKNKVSPMTSKKMITDAIATNGNIKEFLQAITGGVFGREGFENDAINMVVNAVLMDMSQNQKSVSESVSAVGNMLATSQLQFTYEKDEFAFYVPLGAKDTNGNAINAAVVSNNLYALTENKENMVAFLQNEGLYIPGSTSAIVNADSEMTTNYFANYLVQHGRFVMNDSGDGVMLVYPALYGADASSSGSGFNIPVVIQQGDKRVPFSIPFSALNKFTKDSIYMGDNSVAHILGKEYKGNDKF